MAHICSIAISRFVGSLALAGESSSGSAPADQPMSWRWTTSEAGVKIDRNIFGQFAEHLGNGVYEGIWVGIKSPIPIECHLSQLRIYSRFVRNFQLEQQQQHEQRMLKIAVGPGAAANPGGLNGPT